jgi:hypothetical protein
MRIDQALVDPNLLGAALGDPAPWSRWLTVLKAFQGVRLSEFELAFFQSVSGDREAPPGPCSELWAIVGRRSGKSRMAAAMSVWAALQPHRLAPGEVATVLVLSTTKAQAGTVFRYALGFLESAPLLTRETVSVTSNEIRLRGNIVISIHTANFRTIRGRTVVAAVFDECAFWRDESSSSPDTEVYRAVLPSLAASNGPLIGISTPFSRTGLLHDKFKRCFGIDDADCLVVRGKSLDFNLTLNPKIVEKAFNADPEAASSEWLAEFRADITSFFDDKVIEAAVDPGRPLELPFQYGVSYHAFVDASGGRGDSYTACIGHRLDDGHFVCDLMLGQPPPFQPAEVTRWFAEVIRSYGIRRVTGDNYSAQWVAGAWETQGFNYVLSDLPASQLYLEAQPVFNGGKISIPDHKRLVSELRSLERRTSRMGRDSVTHPPGGHDDFANALAGCLRVAHAKSNKAFVSTYRGGF